MAAVGTVSQRAAVGHGPRGLQPERRRVELLHPRPGAVARVSLGRGRARRLLGPQAAAVFRAGALERQGPDPEGAALRLEQRRREPRRGRQGILLLSRLHTDPLVHEVALQVSAGGVSLRRDRRRPTRAARATSSSTSSSTPACSTATATSTSFVEYAKSTPEECLIRITVANRGPEAATIHLLPTLWFRNTWSWWPEAGKPSLAAARTTRRGERRGGVTSGTRRALALLRRRAAAAVHRERDEHRAAVRRAERQPLRQGRFSRAT